MFTMKRCSLIRGVHYERFHCTPLFLEANYHSEFSLALFCHIIQCLRLQCLVAMVRPDSVIIGKCVL